MTGSLPKTPGQQKNNTSRSPEQYSNTCNGISELTGIRKRIYEKLDENPLSTAKDLAKLLDLPYKQYRNYLTKERSNWKYYHKNERGSKCSSLHNFKGKLKLDYALSSKLRGDVLFALDKRRTLVDCRAGGCGGCGSGCCLGWVLSRARNKFLVWKGKLGRVTWFTTGTVLLHVKKPGNLGRAKQLFCDAFGSTELITDVKMLVAITDGLTEKVGLKSLGVYQKGVHAPYLTNQRLPSMTIFDFEESHGITIKVGDRSHPNAVEVIAQFPAQTERLIEQIGFVVKKLEATELENVELKASLSRFMTAFDAALGKVPETSLIHGNENKLGEQNEYTR